MKKGIFTEYFVKLAEILSDKNSECIILDVKIKIGMEKSHKNLSGGLNGQILDVKLPFLLSGKHRAFPINDDSMPPLHKGNLIVCKFVESHAEIIEGATYTLITMSQNIVYKRIKKHPNKKDTIILDSDNKNYLPLEVKVKDIVEIWEFVCSLNIDAYKPGELNIGSVIKMLRELHVEIKPID